MAMSLAIAEGGGGIEDAQSITLLRASSSKKRSARPVQWKKCSISALIRQPLRKPALVSWHNSAEGWAFPEVRMLIVTILVPETNIVK
jgi:hypothetical protein